MGLLQQWRDKAYSETANKGDLQRLWTDYFQKERDIYAQLLKNPDEVVTGTVKELAEKYGVDLMTMVGFLDGINDSLKEEVGLFKLVVEEQINLREFEFLKILLVDELATKHIQPGEKPTTSRRLLVGDSLRWNGIIEVSVLFRLIVLIESKGTNIGSCQTISQCSFSGIQFAIRTQGIEQFLGNFALCKDLGC